MRRLYTLLFLLPLLLAVTVQAQPVTTPEPNPNATISYPPPVYVVSGQFEVRGTANLAGMTGYILEYRRLNDDLTEAGDDVPWTPATLTQRVPVVDGVLGTWDTTATDDGVYELQLAVIMSQGENTTMRVSPLRIENEPPPFAVQPVVTVVAPVVTQEPAPDTGGPAVTARVNANVRSGDSTAFPAIGSLPAGQSATVVGRSNRGDAWFYIVLPNGRRGWIAPSTVDVSGNVSGVPVVTPAPDVATSAPAATAAPTAGALPDATISNVRFDRELRQGQAFQIIVTVFNPSSVALPGVSVACNFTPMNNLFSATIGGLNPGAVIDVAITAQLDSGGGANVTANCAVDLNNVVAESNEENNYFNLTAFLQAP
ncbi:MAG: SH3 domain-containing protein [Anaerolineae bacterium]|nr:SH3 domain-containing protein [Anaerolineae bacterium]